MLDPPHTIITAVAGAPGVGKSTFIRTLGVPVTDAVFFPETRFRDPASLRRIGVADMGVIDVDSCAAVYLCEIPFFGLPDAVYPGLASFVDNYVVIFDSTRPESCWKTRQILDFVESVPRSAPRIVVANKQDVADALSPRDVGYILALDEGGDVPVLPCVATQRADVKRVLLELFRRFATAGDAA
jgi:signal recognition particle receptor subunit beta